MLKPGVSFIVPFRIYLPEKFYEVNLNKRKFLVKPQPIPPIQIDKGLQAHGANIEFSHDIFGNAGRTLFHVVLDHDIDVSTEDLKRDFANNDKLFTEDAILAVNRLLEVYRDQDQNNIGERSFHIIPVVKADISDIRIVPVDEDLSEDLNLCIRTTRFGSMGFGAAVIRSGVVVNTIEKLLKDGTTIPIYRELLYSSMNAIYRGQYRLSPIESNTAFEAFIPEITALIDPSTSSSSLTNLFDKLVLLETTINRKHDELSLPNISWFLPAKNGWKSLNDPTLLKWKKECYELRGKVIHEGYSQVTHKKAKESQDVTIAAINYLQGIIQKIM